MGGEVGILVATAFSVGFIHTLLGPDHYVPFVAIARSKGWSREKMLLVTSLCGVGHVLGSVVIGAIGLKIGSTLFRMESLESFRGDVAAWLLIGFGLAYLVWGIVRAIRDMPHTHLHSHADGTVHSHLHQHDVDHCHVHESTVPGDRGIVSPLRHWLPARSLTPWILFLIFVFGPCEVLIPLLMYPAASGNSWAMVMVVLAFTLSTVGTMLFSVLVLQYGLHSIRLPDLHRFGDAMAGFAVLVCGTLVKIGL